MAVDGLSVKINNICMVEVSFLGCDVGSLGI